MGQFDRDITVKGNFNRAVIVNDSFVNGKDCVFVDNNNRFSHAEGFMSNAAGQYSHADGVLAYTKDPRSYVWSGIEPSDDPEHQARKESNGTGTFSVYTKSSLNTSPLSGLNEFFLNGTQLHYIFEKYKSDTKKELIEGENSWTGKNTFKGNGKGIVLTENASISADSNSLVTIDGQATFGGSLVRNDTLSTSTSSNEVATTAFVHSVVQEYLKNILGDDVIKSE